MNPLTQMRQLTKLNERELSAGHSGTKTSWHEQYRDSAWVFVGGLPFDLTEGDVLAVFSQYGEPTHVNLVRDRSSGKSRGFGFLCYEDQRSTDLAVDNFNGIELCGRKIRVDHCSDYRVSKHELNSAAELIDPTSEQLDEPAHLSLSLVSVPQKESSGPRPLRERDKLPPSGFVPGARASPPTRVASKSSFELPEAAAPPPKSDRERTHERCGRAEGTPTSTGGNRHSAHARFHTSPERDAKTGDSARLSSRDTTESRKRRSRSKEGVVARKATNSSGSTAERSTSGRERKRTSPDQRQSRFDSKRSLSRERRKREHKRGDASPIWDALRSKSSSRSRSESSSSTIRRHTAHRRSSSRHRERKHQKP